MSTSRDRQVESHQVWDQIRAVRQALTGASTHLQDAKIDAIEAHNRIETVIEYIATRLDRSDAALVPIGPLDRIYTSLSDVVQDVNSFASDQDIARLNSASTHADTALLEIARVPVAVSADDVGNLREDATRFRQSIGQQLFHINAQVSGLEALIAQVQQQSAELGQEIESQKGVLQQEVAEFNRATSDLTSGFDELTGAKLEELSQAFDTAQQEHQKARNEALLAWREDLDKKKLLTDQELKTLMDSLEAKADEQAEVLTSRTNEIIEDMESKLEDARDLLSVIGNVGITGQYQEHAKAEHRDADIWRYVGFSLIAIGSIGATLLVLLIPVEDLSLTEVVRRLGIGILFASGGALALRESAQHRRQERIYRGMELELASLDAFIELMPPDGKQEVKKVLVPRYFVGHESPGNAYRDDGD